MESELIDEIGRLKGIPSFRDWLAEQDATGMTA